MLGVLGERENTEFRRHAAGCPHCQHEITERTKSSPTAPTCSTTSPGKPHPWRANPPLLHAAHTAARHHTTANKPATISSMSTNESEPRPHKLRRVKVMPAAKMPSHERDLHPPGR
ncbi:zf-HC2 domain-containing protein [Kibdelosporangium banguiense]|uniref:zf-HC2 domain-containing protein n=1 Tax=Kibdelosporangium banguiense TaxID=1365924 RepID=UPI0027DDAFDF|nr:zf-HC2 domain-containing protein [Kibdelosporangium banguiense]